MRYGRLLLICTTLSIFFSACKSGEQLYQSGRYDEAVIAFTKKLRQRPQDAVSRDMLPKAYAQAQQVHEERINSSLRTDNDLKWEAARKEYRSLQRLYDAFQRSPAAKELVQPKDYRNAITGAQENAAQARYDRGMYLLSQGDKPAARQAYDEFAATLKLVPNYRDAKQRRDEAYQLAVFNVVVSEVDMLNTTYKFSADWMRDDLTRTLQQKVGNRFVEFTNEWLARNNSQLRPDQYLDLRIYDFAVGQTFVDRYEREVSRQIEVSSKTDTTGKVIRRYEVVKGTIYITKKTVVTGGYLDFRVLDAASKTVLIQDRIPGNYTWVNQIGTFRGDERALSDEDRKLLGGVDGFPPPAQELFKAFAQPVFERLAHELQYFYNRY
ncbi:hypothetical protein KTO58_08300 [Chitinophaga pendula]|uniref:hypothetical protein n=1 Tax=Chitinophaga TaxID=79328 RepID=UPI000BB02797|nr:MULTISPECIES: hypothetical protein [Chitinophaga]ASZ13207.1 hypothetical protein CK934_20705 [Chitinophaga sp. MD30]UCJ09172.1 hypothetical protein KTO58_08300 [Chitinophaga pendula]